MYRFDKFTVKDNMPSMERFAFITIKVIDKPPDNIKECKGEDMKGIHYLVGANENSGDDAYRMDFIYFTNINKFYKLQSL